jgi:hypothetical protein
MKNQFRNDTEALQPRPAFRCPCCRLKTLRGRAQYEIREVRYWEDDGQDDHDANEVRGGTLESKTHLPQIVRTRTDMIFAVDGEHLGGLYEEGIQRTFTMLHFFDRACNGVWPL